MTFGIPDTGDYRVGHELHDTTMVDANMVQYLDCDTCQIILAVWNENYDLLWKNGMSHADLIHYVGHDYLGDT